MTYYIRAFLLTLIEALCCRNFFEVFLKQDNKRIKWFDKLLLAALVEAVKNLVSMGKNLC